MSFAMCNHPRTLTLLRRVSMTTYSSDKAVPYVYICTHKETNQFYIGYRMANVKLNRPSHLDLPEYKTSSTTVRPDWENYTWTIIAEFFDPSHAYTFEQQLICDNWKNPLLLNEQYRLGKIKQFRNTGGKPTGKQQNPHGPHGPHGKQQNPGTRSPRGPYGKQQNPSGPRGTSGKQQNPAPEVECPHCGLVGRGGNMTRYHFDNCKMKPT